MKRRELIIRCKRLLADERWRSDRTTVVREAARDLSSHPDDLLNVMLTEAQDLREAAFECLAATPLPGPVLARLESVVTISKDLDQVAWSLTLRGRHENAEPVAKHVVERAIGLGGVARGAAISVIPYVDADSHILKTWLLDILDAGDESDCIRVMNAALLVAEAFGKTILERVCAVHAARAVSEALYLTWYSEPDREWTVKVIRQAVSRFPSEESILRPALFCIKDRQLRVLEDIVIWAMRSACAAIAAQAAEVMAGWCPPRAPDE